MPVTSAKLLHEEAIKEVIKQIFPNNTCVVTIEPGSKSGDGFLGITSSVQVEIDKTKVKHLFIKQVSHNETFRRAVHLEEAYRREIYFYTTLQPILNKICFKHTKKLFEITPKCYFTSEERRKEVLVFDDLVAQGYTMLPKVRCFDGNHMKWLLKRFSQLHACGFILKQEQPKYFAELKRNMGEMFFKICKEYNVQNCVRFAFNILKEQYAAVNDKIILDNLDSMRNKVIQSTFKTATVEEYPTVVHIDCWLNNVMFKYEDDTKELEDIKLLDFQMWMINSPIFDVLHIFYSNASSKEMLDNYTYYQNYYYNSLSEYIVAMKGDPEVLYPREAFIAQWKKHCYYGLLYATLILRGTMIDSRVIQHINEKLRQNKLDEVFIYNVPDEEEFGRRMKSLLYHFIEQNML